MSDPGENSTQATDSDSEWDLESEPLFKAAISLWKVIPPIIMVFGTFGNSMIIIILRRMSLGGASHSMSVFFGALAVSDFLLMYTGLLRQWLFYLLDTDIRNLHTVVCKLHTFVVYALAMMSAWFLVCMTMQRVMSVVWPHRVGVQCTRRKSMMTVVVVVVVLLALNAHNLVALSLTSDSDYDDDNVELSCENFESPSGLQHYDLFIYTWIDLLVSSLIPSAVLFIANAVLASSVTGATRRAGTMMARQGQAAQQQTRARKKAASSLTLTLMSVSTTFLLLTLPLSVYLLVDSYLAEESPYEVARQELAWAVINMLWYSNSAVNFYVYCLTGTKFRAECKSLFFCCRKEQQGAARAGSENVTGVYTLSSASSCSRNSVSEVTDGAKSQGSGSLKRKMSF